VEGYHWRRYISIVTPPGSFVQSASRPRAVCAGLALITIALGLASRRFGAALPDFVRTYAGDTLWASTAYLVAATVWPRASTLRLAAGSLAFAVAIEGSQLYHAPWIDDVRSARLGALVLGFGFLWSDLICYSVGVAMAAGVDQLLLRRRQSR
jgi:hypothetical protein